MSTSAEGKVRRAGTLGHQTVTVISLLIVFNIGSHDRLEAGVFLTGLGVPTMRLPQAGLGEVLGRLGGNTGGGKENVGSRDNVGSSLNRHRRLDGTHDAVNRAVQTQSLLDNLRVEGQAREIFKGQLGEVGTKNGLLFGKQLLDNVGARSET